MARKIFKLSRKLVLASEQLILDNELDETMNMLPRQWN
jgi:hypothetical protein